MDLMLYRDKYANSENKDTNWSLFKHLRRRIMKPFIHEFKKMNKMTSRTWQWCHLISFLSIMLRLATFHPDVQLWEKPAVTWRHSMVTWSRNCFCRHSEPKQWQLSGRPAEQTFMKAAALILCRFQASCASSEIYAMCPRDAIRLRPHTTGSTL